MNQIWNRNHYYFQKIDLLVSSTMLILCPISIGPISIALPGQKLQNDLNFSFEIWAFLTRLT